MNHSKALWTIFFTTVISVLALIFTGSKCVYSWIFGFESANEFGDFVGGVAGPIIAIGGAYLVYLTIREQIEANRTQREALETEIEYRNRRDDLTRIETVINSVTKDIQSLSYTTVGTNYQGTSALRMVFEDLEKNTLYNGEGIIDVVNHSIFMLSHAMVIIEINARKWPLVDIKEQKSILASVYNSYLQKFVQGFIGPSIPPEYAGKQVMISFQNDFKFRFDEVEKIIVDRL